VKIPTLKIAPSSPRNSLFIGHASNPPYPYQNTTKSIKFGLKIILMYGLRKVKLKIKWPDRLKKTQI
jgi:hypothetical protein